MACLRTNEEAFQKDTMEVFRFYEKQLGVRLKFGSFAVQIMSLLTRFHSSFDAVGCLRASHSVAGCHSAAILLFNLICDFRDVRVEVLWAAKLRAYHFGSSNPQSLASYPQCSPKLLRCPML